MKKTSLFILLLFGFISCVPSLDDVYIDNPQKITTLELQNNIIDSCVAITTDGMYYFIMKDNLVIYRITPINYNYKVVSIVYLTLSILTIVLLTTILLVVWLNWLFIKQTN